jgi:hypothetical protein
MVGGEGGAKIFNDFLHGSYMKKPGKSRASQKWPKPLFYMVPGDRIELPTRGFSISIYINNLLIYKRTLSNFAERDISLKTSG